MEKQQNERQAGHDCDVPTVYLYMGALPSFKAVKPSCVWLKQADVDVPCEKRAKVSR